MPFQLISAIGDRAFELREGAPLIVGRAVSSDIPVFDPTISRRHAELQCDSDVLRVRDLGSSNGTYHNGNRVQSAEIRPGDEVTFGKVVFRVRLIEPSVSAETPTSSVATMAERTSTTAGGPTIVRQRPVLATPRNVLATQLSALGGTSLLDTLPDHRARIEKKLALLLEVSKGLSGAVDVDALLEKIAGFVFQIMDVDRIAIMLMDPEGELSSRVARDRTGPLTNRPVPQSIARTVVQGKVAVLSENAPEDQRFGGQSILMQSVRSAMCAPLMGAEDTVLGILYVDNVNAIQRFGDDDLDFLIAFSNIAAVAIENSAFAERIRREALVRSNFERYFAPQLAARIARAPDTVKLGGDKRPVAILFSDIRGFTALSEAMLPDEVATLLSEYFTAMVDCVFRHDGTLDKFIGDAVMAQWGAPIGTVDDADLAMAAALDMMRQLTVLNERWRAERRPELHIGIGLSFGEAFAGNIGSERRLEFTVIGDIVNTASRLCKLADGGEVLVSADFRQALRNPPEMTERPSIELKGKSRPVPVYSVKT